MTPSGRALLEFIRKATVTSSLGRMARRFTGCLANKEVIKGQNVLSYPGSPFGFARIRYVRRAVYEVHMQVSTFNVGRFKRAALRQLHVSRRRDVIILIWASLVTRYWDCPNI